MVTLFVSYCDLMKPWWLLLLLVHYKCGTTLFCNNNIYYLILWYRTNFVTCTYNEFILVWKDAWSDKATPATLSYQVISLWDVCRGNWDGDRTSLHVRLLLAVAELSELCNHTKGEFWCCFILIPINMHNHPWWILVLIRLVKTYWSRLQIQFGPDQILIVLWPGSNFVL